MDARRKTISRSIRNVQYCPATGYLIEPANVKFNNKIYTRHFLLAYRAIPKKKFRKDYINPVDPASIVCTCSSCGPAIRRVPVNMKTIVACPQPLPPIPKQSSNKKWKPLPRKPYVFWSRRSSTSVFRLKWMRRAGDPGAKIDHYELFYYREIPGKTYTNTTPWTFSRNLKHPKTLLGNFNHGGLYHYAVRCVDVHGRRGAFSDPTSLFLTVN